MLAVYQVVRLIQRAENTVVRPSSLTVRLGTHIIIHLHSKAIEGRKGGDETMLDSGTQESLRGELYIEAEK